MDPQRPSRPANRAGGGQRLPGQPGHAPRGAVRPGARRRRHSRRTYLIRRVIALGLAIAVVYGAVSVVTSLFGDDDDTVAGEDSTPTIVDSTDSTDVSVSSSIAPTTTGESTTTTTIDVSPVPTPENPARVYVAGDSDAGAFAPFLERQLRDTGLTALTVDYKVSSGLARPDFFDWPARLAAQMPVVDPDIVVVTFGGNDGQPINGNQVDSQAWRDEYGQRVAAVMDFLSQDGRKLIWVGIPNAAGPGFTERLTIQNEVVKAQAALHPDVTFVDAWSRFTGIDGGYAEYVADPRDGQFKPVRASDGFHLNTNGAEILALDIAGAVNDELRARGAAI